MSVASVMCAMAAGRRRGPSAAGSSVNRPTASKRPSPGGDLDHNERSPAAVLHSTVGMNRKLLALFLAASCLGCGAESPTGSTEADSDCSNLGQVQFVRTTLRDIYLWYRDLPDPAPSGFSSPEAYLEAVRNKTLDESYSYIADQAESDAFFSESQFIGVGVSYQQTTATQLRVTQVYAGGPAAEAGLARGDYLLAINGTAVGTLLANNGLDAAFGPSTAGVAVTLAWRTPQGGEFSARLVKRAVTIPTVSPTAVYDQGRAGRVGYVHFRNFVQPSTAALNTAFADLDAADVNELILDLRYNGGGLISVATHLAGLIGGERTRNQVFVEFFHNDKNTAENSVQRFPVPAQRPGRLAAGGDHHARLRLGQRGDHQRPPPVHPGDGGGRHHVREARRAIRLRLLRQDAVPGVVPGAQRARGRRLLRRHPRGLRRPRRPGPPAGRLGRGLGGGGAALHPHGVVHERGRRRRARPPPARGADRPRGAPRRLAPARQRVLRRAPPTGGM